MQRFCVTLVHGTWGGNAAFLKAQSRFQAQLALELRGQVDFVPFYWSGRNSQAARLLAATDLQFHLEKMATCFPHSRHIVICHSHGGNVALYALVGCKARNLVSGMICMGTPFLYRRSRNIAIFSVLGGLFAAGFVAALMNLVAYLLVKLMGDYHAFEQIAAMQQMFAFSCLGSLLSPKPRERLKILNLVGFASAFLFLLSVSHPKMRAVIDSSWMLSHLMTLELLVAEFAVIAVWICAPGAWFGLKLYEILRMTLKTVVKVYPEQRDYGIPVLNIPVEFDEAGWWLLLIWNLGDLMMKVCHWTVLAFVMAWDAVVFGGASIVIAWRVATMIEAPLNVWQLIPATIYNAFIGIGLTLIIPAVLLPCAAAINILSRQHPLGFGAELPSLQWVSVIRTQPIPGKRVRACTKQYGLEEIVTEVGWRALFTLRHSWPYSSPTVIGDIASWIVNLPFDGVAERSLYTTAVMRAVKVKATVFDWLLWLTAALFGALLLLIAILSVIRR